MAPAKRPDRGQGAVAAKAPGAAPPVVAEHRICPISGLNTLQGVCPFAKPKKGAEASDGPKAMLRLRLSFRWERDGSEVSVDVQPHYAEHFATLALPDSASAEQVRRRYKELVLAHHPDKHPDDPEGN